ncbi:MAG: response regulator transcription factor [Thermincola sp.]|jgi:DNA-binding NarL/FixJ family response regulator|nr:response regulator transcription factor [Thermincola sp.]MDT3704551.1 response regulator transcription factor [Thermincola sp.]
MDTVGKKIKVLVVDNYLVVMVGTVSLLSIEPRIFVVGTAKNGEECLQLAGEFKPDIILMGINLPDIYRFNLIEKLRETHPQIKVIVFTGQNPEEYVNSSLAKGVKGFLLKDCSANEMIEAVLSVYAGKNYYSQNLGAIPKSFVTGEEHSREISPLDSKDMGSLLTPRELEILELIVKGLQNKEIAGKLGVKTKTIEYHIGNILSKLGVNSRLEAVLRIKTKF